MASSSQIEQGRSAPRIDREAVPASSPRSRPSRRGWWQGYLFILPTALGLGIFSLWPIFQTLYFLLHVLGSVRWP